MICKLNEQPKSSITNPKLAEFLNDFPKIYISPLDGVINPINDAKKVVFPAPFFPRIPIISLDGSSIEMFFNTRNFP